MENRSNPKLKVGLLLHSLEQPSWVCRMTEVIQQSDYAEVRLVVSCQSAGEAPRSLPARAARSWRGLVENAYRYTEQRIFPHIPDASVPGDLRQILPKVPNVKASLRQATAAAALDPADVAQVRTTVWMSL